MACSGNGPLNGIGFGTWAWGNQLIWGYNPPEDDERLAATFKQALRSGLRLIDTADSYGTGRLNGRSELLLGQFIEAQPEHLRSGLVVATKLAPFPWRLGRRGLERAFHASRKRLKGHLNRVQLHWSTARYAPWQEVDLLDGLADLVEQGLVAELGVSNVGPQRLAWMQSRLAERNLSLCSVQVQCSLLAPDDLVLQELLQQCEALGIEVLAYSPLAFGVLSCPPDSESEPTTWLRGRLYRRLLPASLNLRRTMADIAVSRGVSMVQVALNWCRANGSTPIPGIRTPAQAQDVASALTWTLTPEEKRSLDLERKNCRERMPANPFQSR